MYYLILLVILCLSSFAETDDTSQKQDETIQQIFRRKENGEYFYKLLTENNIISIERSQLATTSQGEKYFKVIGHYSYVDPTGYIRIVQYTADENGYHPNKMLTLPYSTQEDKDKVTALFKPAYKPPKEPRPPGAGTTPTAAEPTMPSNMLLPN